MGSAVAERKEVLEKAGYNAVKVPGRLAQFNFASDAQEHFPVAEVAEVAGSFLHHPSEPADLSGLFQELCPGAHFAFFTKGRSAENAFVDAIQVEAPVIVTHGLFSTTTRALQGSGAKIEKIPTAGETGFCDVDCAALSERISAGGVHAVYLETGNNGLNGWPLRLENVVMVREICDANGVELYLDGTRALANAHTLGGEPFSLARKFFELADAFTISCSKEYLSPFGSLVGSRKPEIAARAAKAGFFAGTSIGPLDAPVLHASLGAGFQYMQQHPELLAERRDTLLRLANELEKRSVPMVSPIGGHAVFLVLPDSAFREKSLEGAFSVQNHFYLCGGVLAQVFPRPAGGVARLALGLGRSLDCEAAADAIAECCQSASSAPLYKFVEGDQEGLPFLRDMAATQ